MFRSSVYTKFNSEYFSYLHLNWLKTKVKGQGTFELPSGLSSDLVINDPVQFTKVIKEYLRSNKVRSRRVIHVLPEEVILTKVLTYKKDVFLQKLDKKFMKILLNDIFIPFENPLVEFYVVNSSKDEYEVLFIIVNKEIIDNDIAIFSKLGFRHIYFEVPYTLLYRLHYQLNEDEKEPRKKTYPDLDGQLISIITDTYLAITVYDKEVPVITMNELFEDKDKMFDVFSSYIDRYQHFYKYSVHKGSKEVQNIKIINATSSVTNDELKDNLVNCGLVTSFDIYDPETKKDKLSSSIVNSCRILHAASMKGGK